jgi:hypothetical protein
MTLIISSLGRLLSNRWRLILMKLWSWKRNLSDQRRCSVLCLLSCRNWKRMLSKGGRMTMLEIMVATLVQLTVRPSLLKVMAMEPRSRSRWVEGVMLMLMLPYQSSARLHGGLKTALECYKRRLDVAVEQANHVNLEDLETCTEASEKLTAAYVDLQAQCAGKAAAEGSGDAWQQQFAAWVVGVRPAKERLAAAIKQLQVRQQKNMYQAASQAVDRALAAADDAIGGNDPDEIEEVRQQLSTKVREMEAAAVYLDGNPLLQDGQKLQAAERSMMKLGKKKTELLQTDVGSSPRR